MILGMGLAIACAFVMGMMLGAALMASWYARVFKKLYGRRP